MSTHLCLIAWNVPIGRPNCMRVVAYSALVDTPHWQMPTTSDARATAAFVRMVSMTSSAAPDFPTSCAGLARSRATIASGGRPWELTFETDELERERTLSLKTSIRNLVPRSLAPAVPQLSLLQAFDMPVAGNATLELSSEGTLDRVDGVTRFTEIVLRPRLTLGPGGDRARALWVLEKCKKACLVTASLSAPVRLEPEIAGA